MLPQFQLSEESGRQGFERCLQRLRASTGTTGELAEAAARIIEDVRQRGDAAIVEQEQRWTNPDFQAGQIRVSPDELAEAEDQLSKELHDAIRRAIGQVSEYQQHIMPQPVKPIELGGAELGMRYSPVDSAGLLVPGGSAVLFSTLIMLAVPAQVAGVPGNRLAAIHPAPYRSHDEPARDISTVFKATACMLGIEHVYRIGGAHGVAALAHGTESVQPVDMLAGPGHPIVQIAKTQLAGVLGNEGGVYGPSEITTIADEKADPARVASDLIAQAEHDPGKCFLVTWSQAVIDAVLARIAEQMQQRSRCDAIEKALAEESCAVLVRDAAEAAQVANRIACEHLNLAVEDPDALLQEIRHAGEVFLGDGSPVASGDYYAGPSHCLPTGTTARFASGVSVHTFLKRTGTVRYRLGPPERAIADIAAMAEAEGLDGHAASVRTRR